MKRSIIIGLSAVLMGAHAYAIDTNEICHYTSSALFVLDRNANGTSSTVDGKSFRVEFDYDMMSGTRDSEISTISGSGSCNEINVKSSADGKSSNDGTAQPGDANTFLRTNYMDVGQYCWCKMDGPITSYWVYVKEYTNESGCESDCATFCANGLKNATSLGNNRNVRDALFDAIW